MQSSGQPEKERSGLIVQKIVTNMCTCTNARQPELEEAFWRYSEVRVESCIDYLIVMHKHICVLWQLCE